MVSLKWCYRDALGKGGSCLALKLQRECALEPGVSGLMASLGQFLVICLWIWFLFVGVGVF